MSATANNADTIFEPVGSDWTWAGVGSANGTLLMASWWRRATAGDPAQWTFYMYSGTATAMAYGLEVYSGADPVNTPVIAADESQGTATSSSPFPNSTGPYDGMMRYLSGGARANVSQSIAGGPTTSCNRQIASASLITAHELVASGTTATRTVTRTASADSIMQSLLIRPACTTGGLGLTPPTTISFPSQALTGSNGFATTSFSAGIDDERGSSAGWHLTASASQFTTAGGTMPTTAASITSVSASAGAASARHGQQRDLPGDAVRHRSVDLQQRDGLHGQGPRRSPSGRVWTSPRRRASARTRRPGPSR